MFYDGVFFYFSAGYIVELKSKYDTNFVKAVEVQGPICTAKIPKLDEGQQYQFRVRAVNKAGPGEASEPTLPHTAKPKLRKYSGIRSDTETLWSIHKEVSVSSKALYGVHSRGWDKAKGSCK